MLLPMSISDVKTIYQLKVMLKNDLLKLSRHPNGLQMP